MDLVRELLDEQLVDRRRRAVGKVDGIVLVAEPARAPRVVAIEVGSVTLAHRVHPALARWLLALMRRLGVGNGEPLRVPIADLSKEGVDLRVDVNASETPAFAWERWVRDRIIGRIPGSGL